MIRRALASFVVVSLFANLAAGQVALRTQRPLELRLAEDEPAPGLLPAHVVGKARVIYVRPQSELDDRDMQGASVVKGTQ